MCVCGCLYVGYITTDVCMYIYVPYIFIRVFLAILNWGVLVCVVYCILTSYFLTGILFHVHQQECTYNKTKEKSWHSGVGRQAFLSLQCATYCIWNGYTPHGITHSSIEWFWFSHILPRNTPDLCNCYITET